MSESLSKIGPLCGVDLSPQAIKVASRRCPCAEFHCGDISDICLGKHFDVVVTADTIAHVADQAAFVNRIASLMIPGGTLLLMSQNAYAFERSSWVKPVPGQYRNWPTLRELRALLAHDFDIEQVTTAAPGAATSGIYRFFNARSVYKPLCALIGKRRYSMLYETLRLGSEWVIVARRR